MSEILFEIIETPIGMMCAKKYAREIGKSDDWVINRIKDGSIPSVDDDSKSPRYMVNILKLNTLLRTEKLRITAPRKKAD